MLLRASDAARVLTAILRARRSMEHRHHLHIVLQGPIKHLVNVGLVVSWFDLLKVSESHCHISRAVWSVVSYIDPVPVAHRKSNELDTPFRHLLEVFLLNSVVKVLQNPTVLDVTERDLLGILRLFDLLTILVTVDRLRFRQHPCLWNEPVPIV